MTSEPSNNLQQALDRLAIQDLVYNYNHALDRRDESLFASLWVPQATCGPAVGAEAIVGAFRKASAAYAELHHLTSNLVIAIEGQRATSRSKSIIKRVAADAAAASRPLTFVSYEDEFVRVEGGWKFLRRQFTAHDAA